MKTNDSMDSNEFESTIRTGVTLVDFNAPWCAPCRSQHPIIEQLAKQFSGRASVIELNVDENQALAMQLKIMSIPTLVIFKEGEENQRFVGTQSAEVLSEAIEKALV